MSAGIAEWCSGAGADSALHLALRVLQPLLADPEVTEVCINRPGEAYVESAAGWHRHAIEAMSYDWCNRFAKLVANATRQRVDETSPLLAAWLPGGERVQIVLPPATQLGCIAITIRRAAIANWSLGELARRSERPSPHSGSVDSGAMDKRLRYMLATRQHEAFLRLAVRCRKNILVSGPTGSGKTTWTKALIGEIPPDERLVSIEDTQELVLDRHPNHVRLFYSKDSQGLARVGPRQLLESTLRMRPDRILLAELRSDEAFEYLRSVNSGHPGSITSIHASSVALALEQLVLLVKQSAAGRELSRADVLDTLRALVDVVIQCGFERHRRFVKEIWYAPAARS